MTRPSPGIASSNGVPRQPTRLTRGRLLVAISVVFVGGLVAAALDLRFEFGGSPRSVEPNSLLVLAPQTGVSIRDAKLGATPGALTLGPRGLDVAVGGAAARFDPRTLAREGAAPPPSATVRGAGLVWTLESAQNKLFATDPVARRIVRTETVGSEPVAVAVGYGAAWVANAGNGTITYVPLTSEKLETIGLVDQPTEIAVGAGAVWVVSTPSMTLTRIDPETKEVTKRIRLANPPEDVAAGGGRVYVTIG